MKHYLFSLFFAILFSVSSVARTIEDVSLVTSASAPTEEKAIILALRSAIEQTYGSFVSANTQILNDELVMDEIVSVSHGNVKSYEKLSSNILSNGQVSVTLKAIISISNLTNFAKSKGAQAEFAGQTFAMNIKLMKLREENALAAYEHMCALAGELVKGAFNYKITLGEPIIGKSVLRRSGREGYYGSEDQSTSVDGYRFRVNVSVLATAQTSQIYDLINNTLNSIKLSDTETEDYLRVGKYPFCYSWYYPVAENTESSYRYIPERVYHRANPGDIILPICSEEGIKKIISLDQKLTKKTIETLMNHSVIEIADEQSYVTWVPNNVAYSLKSIKWRDCKIGEELSQGAINTMLDKQFNVWLVNSRGIIQTALFYGKQDKIFGNHIYGLCLNSYVYFSGFSWKGGFINERIDIESNWDKWKLPIITKYVPVQTTEDSSASPEKSRKKKKSRNSNVQMKMIEEYSTVEQPITEYSFPYFITTKQMESFAGLKIQIPAVGLKYQNLYK